MQTYLQRIYSNHALSNMSSLFSAAFVGFASFKIMSVNGAAYSMPMAALIAIATAATVKWSHTAQKLKKEKSRRQQAQKTADYMQKFIEYGTSAAFIVDADAMIAYANERVTEYCNMPPDSIEGKSCDDLKKEFGEENYIAKLWADIQDKQITNGELRGSTPCSDKWYSWNAIKIMESNRSRPSYIVFIYDVSTQKDLEHRIDNAAFRDHLTDLPNRRQCQELFNAEMASDSPKGTFLILNLDRFKFYNDTMGHDAGDKLLQMTASRIQEHVRDKDVLARLSGDEFVVMLRNTLDPKIASRVTSEILMTVSQPYHIDGHGEVFLSGSVGISWYPEGGKTWPEITRTATSALETARSKGKGQYMFYKKGMCKNSLATLEMDNDLRGALINQEFVLHYQPQVDSVTGKLAGLEALIRWNHPKNGLVPPIAFIPLLESNGLIVQAGYWVIEETCRQIARWREQELDVPPVSVNVASIQVIEQDFSKNVKNIMSEHLGEGTKNALVVEITESILMSDRDEAMDNLNKLDELGIKVSIDDFGTGYSSFSYIKKLPISCIKIDRSFVKHINSDTDDAAITSAIVSMASELGLSVVAEGAETSSQVNYLYSLGCNVIQGYYYSKPCPGDDLKCIIRDGFPSKTIENM